MTPTDAADRSLPTGTVTFLRTDIEGSTRLAQAMGPAWEALHATHQRIVRAAITTHHGHEVRTEGDAFLVAFPDAGDAVAAAASINTALAAEPWPEPATIRVRIGLHAGAVQRSGDDYGGVVLHRTARIAEAAAGGQTVVSDAVRALAAGSLPAGCALRALGWFRLRGFDDAERLFQLDVEGLPVNHPPLRGVVADADHLPLTPTSFIGRDRELARLVQLLTEARLVTLTGPGGTGKTRLAIELGRRVLARYPDGAWFIDLATVTDPRDVLPAIARGVGLTDGTAGPAVDRLCSHLAGRTTLLIVDNLEQVVAAAPDIAGLLGCGPGVSIVVTSRIPLGRSAEQVVPVRPLGLERRDVPTPDRDGHSAAVVLFLERMRRARPDLQVDEAVRSHAAAICAAVDGLPLGIELAAARTRSLPLSAIRDRLTVHAPLPGTAPKDLPARHQTLERTIGWSLGLLEPEHLERFGRLGAFEGGIGLDQAEAMEQEVVDRKVETLDGLMALVDQSLLVPAEAVAETRFEMLETIRAAAVDLLVTGRAGAPEAVVRAHHADAFLDLARRASEAWGSRRQADWLVRLSHDHANLRAALGWAIEAGAVEVARGLSSSLWRYWLMRGDLAHGRASAEAVLAMPGGERVDASLAGALDAAGGLAYWMGDPVAADACYRRQLEVARQVADSHGIAEAAFNLAHTRFILGDAADGHVALDEARESYREIGDDRGLLRVDWGLAVLSFREEPAEVVRLRALSILERARALDDLPYVALTAGEMAWAALRLEDPEDALRYGLLSLRVSRLLGDRASVAMTFLPAAQLALGLGRPEDAARLLGQFESLCETSGFRPPAGLEQLALSADPSGHARAALGEPGYEAAVARGRSMSLDEAIDLAENLGRIMGVPLEPFDAVEA